MRLARATGFGAAAALLAALSGAAHAEHTSIAQPALVLDEQLDHRSIGGKITYFVDPTRSLDFDAVRHLPPERFAPSPDDNPSFGFSRSIFWLRFEVANPRPISSNWYLEIAYPPLDELDLYAPRESGGFKHSVAGDRVPFSQRDIPYRNVTFDVHTPPGQHTYYLRVDATGPVSLPLTAWTPAAFLNHVNVSYPLLWMFYGWMFVMGCYNLFLYFAVRDAAYLHYVMYIVAYTLFQAAMNGLAFQYLWPNATWWTNLCNPALIGLACATGGQFVRSFVNTKTEAPRFHRVMGWVGWGGGAVTVAAAFFGPSWMSVRVAVASAVLLVVAALPGVVWLAFRGQRQARYFIAAWLVFVLGIGLYLLKSMGVLPATTLSEWTMQYGAAAEVLLLSLGLADRINVMRRNLGVLNAELELNVEQLTQALDRAEQARRAKNAFLASVSHELRTPLNAIINIPEGILESFRHVERMRCDACDSRFDLELGEVVEPGTPCPECGSAELQRTQARVFEGDPTSTASHLEHVHRAGTHLLEVVTDILDVSKLEAGRMTLVLTRLDLGEVLCEALEPMIDFARTQGVVLDIPTPGLPMWIRGDRVKLKQVVLNLVGNAIKFSDRRGVVRVSIARATDHFLVGVHDQGIGIRDQDKQRIFEGFEQGSSGDNRRFGGTGLGLSITKRLIALHQGEIWVDSVLGEGSQFYFKLPVAPPAVEVLEVTETVAWADGTREGANPS